MTTEYRQLSSTHIRGVNADQRTVDVVASDFSIDSYGTRIDPNGWDLDQFRRNPVICLQHDSYCDLPVANAIPETVRVENNQLLMTIQFPPEGASEDSDTAFNLIKAGVLRGVSVGFDPSESEQNQEPDGTTVTVFRKQRLMEVSFVTIPSNDNGLVVRSRELNQDVKQLRTLVKEMEIRLKSHQAETEAQEKLSAYKPSHLLACVGYMERKQPANRESTKVLEMFFKRVLKEDQPDNEVEAWKRMAEGIEALEESEEVEEAIEAKPIAEATTTQNTKGVTIEATEETTAEAEQTPTIPIPAEAQQDERKASVLIPLSELAEFPARMTKALTDAGIEALRRGVPIKDACKLIDGMNSVVETSISHISHGNHA